MLENVQNLIYRRPELYDLIYPEPNEETPEMCRRTFDRFLGRFPSSILDMGCGTGRDLAALSRDCDDCVGIDALEEMIAFARSRHPSIPWHLGDMRRVRLYRTFDSILCMGSAFMYAVTNDDVNDTLNTFVAHAHAGTLLVLDLNNASAYLPGGTSPMPTTWQVDTPQFKATAHGTNSFDRRRQLHIRRRRWEIPGSEPIEDYCEYRLIFPA